MPRSTPSILSGGCSTAALDKRTVTPGRTTRVAIVGHSLGASAVSYVQGVDSRVQTAVALDKLLASARAASRRQMVKPKVPALAVQREYGFGVQPYWINHGSSLTPQPCDPSGRRTPGATRDGLRRAGGRPASTACSSSHAPPRTSNTRTSRTRSRPAATARRSRRVRAGVAGPLPQASGDRASPGDVATVTSSRWSIGDWQPVGHWTARSCSASTTAPDGRSVRRVSTDIAGVGGC